MVIRIILLRLLESYFRRRWLYLLPTALLSTAGVLFVLFGSPEYHARGVLYVQRDSLLTSLTGRGGSGTDWWSTPAQAIQADLNELLQTDAFVRAVIRQTPLEQQMDQGSVVIARLMRTVREGVWIQPLGASQLAVNFYHEEPQVAYDMVNSLIDTYLTWRVNAERSETEVAQQFFGSIIGQYEAEIEQARAAMIVYLQEHPAPVRGERTETERMEIARLQAGIDLAAERLRSAISNEEQSRLALAQIESNVRQSHFLIDAPTLPQEPTTSLRETAIDVVIFVAAGIALSVGAIVGGALLDRSFRFSVDVENRLHLPVLAMVPDLAEKKGWPARLLRRNKQSQATGDLLRPSINQETAPNGTGEPALNGAGRTLEGSETESVDAAAEAGPVL